MKRSVGFSAINESRVDRALLKMCHINGALW